MLQQALAGSELNVLPCEGSYFQVVQFRGSQSSFVLAEQMCKDAKVATIPIAAFYPPNHPPGRAATTAPVLRQRARSAERRGREAKELSSRFIANNSLKQTLSSERLIA